MNAVFGHKAGKSSASDFEMIIDVSMDSNNGVFRRYLIGNNAINGIDPLGLVKAIAFSTPKHPDYDKWPDDLKEKWAEYQKSRAILPGSPNIFILTDLGGVIDSYIKWKSAYDKWKEEQEKQINLIKCH